MTDLSQYCFKGRLKQEGESGVADAAARMNILYAVSEMFPFSKGSGLGDVALAFPEQMNRIGEDVRVIMPLYDVIPREFVDQMVLQVNFNVQISFQTLCCGMYELNYRGVTCYFLENKQYFSRGCVYGCDDDDARFAFFSKAVCCALPYLAWHPDIIHCNDWETALIPFYLRDNPKNAPKTVFTIHNVEFQGDFDFYTLTNVFGLSGVLFAQGLIELDGKVNLLRGAVELSDAVTTVSPTYAKQMKTEEISGGLAKILRDKNIVGIRNGIHSGMNPRESVLVYHNYDVDSLEERVYNKRKAQEAHNLNRDDSVPLLGCVSRLLPRKGFDLILSIMDEILDLGAQFLVTGDGDPEIWNALCALHDRYPNRMDITEYSEIRGAEIYSSADLFLMPSRIEPCGIAQMQAMRYGAVPVVHMTGGIADTVIPFDSSNNEGFAFAFTEYTPDAFRKALKGGLEVYQNREAFLELQRRCMKQDFSWIKSAEEYMSLYRSL